MAPSRATVDLSDVGDPTIIALWRDIYSCLGSTQDILSGMVVCSSFRDELPSLVTEIDIPSERQACFEQEQLEYVAKTFPNVKFLSIKSFCRGKAPLDFSTVQLPALEVLIVTCKKLVTFEFTQANTPQLRGIDVNEIGQPRAIDLDLPHLEEFLIQFTTMEDASNLGPSLSRCPKLRWFSAYKVWGLSGTIHKLHLPECTTLAFQKTHDLEGLEVWAPRVSRLVMSNCHDLKHVRIMDDPPGTQPQPLILDLMFTELDHQSKRLLRKHPRVKAGEVLDSRVAAQMMGGLPLGMVVNDALGADTDSDDDEDVNGAQPDGVEGIEGAMGAGHAAGQMEGGPELGGGAPNQGVWQEVGWNLEPMPVLPGDVVVPPMMGPGGFGAAGVEEGGNAE